jgi:integrase
MANVTERRPSRKPKRPKKPSKTYPLFPHANGSWAKKIRGKLRYFGGWSNPAAALALYEAQRADLEAGRTPRSTPADGALTMRILVNHFLTAKRQQLDLSEITPRTFRDYLATCRRMVTAFGKDRQIDDLTAEDFAHFKAGIGKNWGPVTLGNEIQRVRSVFKYGYDAGLIDKPVRYGPMFKRPAKRIVRKARQEAGSRMLEAAEIRGVLEAAKPQLRAMVLLGVNCAFGNADCAMLPLGALDARHEWVTFPRPKTHIERRCPLWSETADALREVRAQRGEPKDPEAAQLVFITKYGKRWGNGVSGHPISHEFRKLVKTLGIYRRGVGFYALRHTFRTVADASRDQRAIDLIMGHTRADMASHYIERIEDDRLVAVTDHVRQWLFVANQQTDAAKEKR